MAEWSGSAESQPGWLLDVYAGDEAEAGVVLWFLLADGRRQRFTLDFPVTFYAAGPFPRLRAAWCWLRQHCPTLRLARVQREELFSGMLDVLAVTAAYPREQTAVCAALTRVFPDLDYYDADIPLSLRLAAALGLFPLAYSDIEADAAGHIHRLAVLESAWELEPTNPPLRLMTIEPDVPPFQATPTWLRLRCGRTDNHMPMQPGHLLLRQLQATLKRHDPDIILTRWGDTWLFPTLLALAETEGVPFNPNRDEGRRPLQRAENSYFTYGQVVYRGRQVHLYGRLHIDQQNAMLYGDYGLEGVFEQARVTGLPIQEIARKSPGAGITAMQMVTALRRGVLVPYQKQQAEGWKTARQLIRADRGGLVYQPLTGLHREVAELDFVSMYPSIMVHYNISPETVGVGANEAAIVPELGIPVDQTREGLVPQTLRPLLAKRIALKQQLAQLTRQDCRYRPLKARTDALKWLLVVCFGYLGYKNARFGRIESHEAVTAYGREALLRAKEAAEAMGFTVLHMYVDGIWVQQTGHKQPADFAALQAEILARTGLPIALEGVYRWVAFLPSRRGERVPVANRYFGVFGDGTVKLRGIEARRRDTAPWVAQGQQEIVGLLTAVPPDQPLESCLPAVWARLRQQVADLQNGQIPLTALLVSQTLSRELAAYRVPSPAARAAGQLALAGKTVRPGQRVRFLYTREAAGVLAWDLPGAEPAATAV
ncbi:MAG TPA: DNA polymerase domain-containing protein, partial [Chloroflexota bacterium]|nr:DNA polymerase domain-containing protein [Chloroflexota bacterium]